MAKTISIIVPFLNEGNWPYKTIQSIYDTSDPNLFEVIAVDENPKDNYDFSRFPDVKHIKNDHRMGVDACRQKGVELAETPHCLILDAHMLLYPNTGWLNKIIDCCKREEKTLWCYGCVAIGYGTEDIYRHKGEYFAADLKLFTEKEKDRPARQIVEPVWANKKESLEYPVQVILGANYAFRKEWFMHIHGFKGLKSWGTSEPFLSLKSWLSGGMCKIRTDVRIAHYFRDNAPYVTNISDLVYNKIYLLKTIFPQDIEDKLTTYIPKDANFKRAMEDIDKNKEEIEKERDYYKSIFTRDVHGFFKEFGIAIPT